MSDAPERGLVADRDKALDQLDIARCRIDVLEARIAELEEALNYAAVVLRQVSNDEDVDASLAVAIPYVSGALGYSIVRLRDLRKGGEDE